MANVALAGEAVDPDALEVEGHEEIASGNAKIAQAKRIRLATKTAPAGSDPWITRVPFEREFAPMKFRRCIDAAKAGKLAMGHVGRAPAVRRSVLEAWIASGAIEPKVKPVEGETAEQMYGRLAGE